MIETHNELNPPGRGRRNLTHITHGGVLMLCAAWELYVEAVLEECAAFLVQGANLPDFLPDRIKGKIAQVANNDRHEHGALKLCGDGWKDVYVTSAKLDCSKLNTPKFGAISGLFQDWLALEPKSVEDAWRRGKEELNQFVTVRGEIAHRGADAPYVRRTALSSYMEMIEDFVVDTDNLLARHLKLISHNSRRPWNVIPIPHQ